MRLAVLRSRLQKTFFQPRRCFHHCGALVRIPFFLVAIEASPQ